MGTQIVFEEVRYCVELETHRSRACPQVQETSENPETNLPHIRLYRVICCTPMWQTSPGKTETFSSKATDRPDDVLIVTLAIKDNNHVDSTL